MDLFGNVEQLFVRETDHRSAHEGTERKPVDFGQITEQLRRATVRIRSPTEARSSGPAPKAARLCSFSSASRSGMITLMGSSSNSAER